MTPLLGPTELQAHVQVMSQRRREALALAYRGECGPGTANDRFWPVRDKTISDPLQTAAFPQRRLRGAPNLAGSGSFHEIERGLKQLKILLVLGHLGAVDLYPFPRTCHTARLKRNDVVP